MEQSTQENNTTPTTSQSNGVQQRQGLRLKPGLVRISKKDWEEIERFIKSRVWMQSGPFRPEDEEDPLLQPINYGYFMLGFDFHLTPDGPKLIEVNTNAGGLGAVCMLTQHDCERELVKDKFVKALKTEFTLAMGESKQLKKVAIVDDDVENQGLYPEMLTMAEWLREEGISCSVVSPEKLVLTEDGTLYLDSEIVDCIYNRLIDFRLVHPSHAHLRKAALAKKVCISPHPSAYVRSADKRNLLKMKDPVVPVAYLLKDKPIEEWGKIKKNFVFKPPEGAGSKGVYRGDKISITTLKKLEPDTVAQEFCPPPTSEGTKYDVRVYTRDTDILALVSRHFTGQVMEMRSSDSGFKAVLPDDVCCLPLLTDPTCTIEEQLPKCAECRKNNTSCWKPEVCKERSSKLREFLEQRSSEFQ